MQVRKGIYLIIFSFLMLGFGSIAYPLVEGNPWTAFDGLYMTVITVFTVGFGEVHPLSSSGRILTIFMTLLGVTYIFYAISLLAQIAFEDGIQEIWGTAKMNNRIKKFEKHYIICGAGKTAHEIIKCLSSNPENKFVVIDVNPNRIAKLQEKGHSYIKGDATNDSVLLQAGVEKALGLAATLPTDADNVFVALSSRAINKDLTIVAKAEKIESIAKLRKAGANKVVSPNIIAGARMASMLYRPTIVDFMDAAMAGDGKSIQMEEFRIEKNSYLENKVLKDADIRNRSGAIIVSVSRDEKTTINPAPTWQFQALDKLVV